MRKFDLIDARLLIIEHKLDKIENRVEKNENIISYLYNKIKEFFKNETSKGCEPKRFDTKSDTGYIFNIV